MTGIYLLGGAIAVALFLYLFVALMKPEWFS
ncbi:MAG: K(+)-transporting ATPase subunit F [Planctomycetota bacterium]